MQSGCDSVRRERGSPGREGKKPRQTFPFVKSTNAFLIAIVIGNAILHLSDFTAVWTLCSKEPIRLFSLLPVISLMFLGRGTAQIPGESRQFGLKWPVSWSDWLNSRGAGQSRATGPGSSAGEALLLGRGSSGWAWGRDSADLINEIDFNFALHFEITRSFCAYFKVNLKIPWTIWNENPVILKWLSTISEYLSRYSSPWKIWLLIILMGLLLFQISLT